MRIAVLVKQIPKFEEMELGLDGRLRRDGIEPEMNPYCRRAVTAGVNLDRDGGSCTVVTLGPPSAEDSLREAERNEHRQWHLLFRALLVRDDALA